MRSCLSVLLFIFLLSPGIKSQAISRTADQLFVQLDRNKYRAGDTIYFQAYIRDRFTGYFESESVSLYALLFNERRSVVDSARFRISRSLCSGWMAIPAKTPSGRYRFSAFTSAMQNSDPAEAFQADLAVSIKAGNSQINPEPAGDSITDLRFLPEGGTLITGIEQRIGFNASDSRGYPMSIEGSLRTRDGTVIKSIRSGAYGPGIFICTPEHGMYVLISKGENKRKIWPLPDPEDNGICISIKKENIRTFVVEIQSDNYTGDSVTVSGSMNMTAIFSRRLKLDKKQRILVGTGELPAGIAQITLFDREMRPVAERLYYVNDDKRLKFNIRQKTVDSNSGEVTEVSVSATDYNGNPAEGIFSISVADSLTGYDPELYSAGMDYTYNYKAMFPGGLPPKALSQGIETLSYDDRDLLLMTYGWRRYSLSITGNDTGKSEMLNYDLLKIIHLNRQRKQAEGAGLNLVSLEGPTVRPLYFNSSGEILFQLDSLPEITTTVTLMPFSKNKKTGLEASLIIPYNDSYFKNNSLFTPQPTIPKDMLDSLPGDYVPSPQDSVTVIQGVTIKAAPAKKKVYQNVYEERYNYANIRTSTPEILHRSIFLETAIREIAGTVSITLTAVYFRPGTSFFGGGKPALIVIDGTPYYAEGWSIAKTIPVTEIASITVLKGNQGRTLYGLEASGGVLFINTMFHDPSQNWRRTDITRNSDDKMLIPVTIYRSNKEFYIPAKLEIDTDPSVNERPTIYWDPEVYFGTREPSRIRFNNLKHHGPVLITVNGVSTDSYFGTGKGRYVVK